MVSYLLYTGVILHLLVGWTLLTTTSASLLLPHPGSAFDRLWYAVSIFSDGFSGKKVALKLRILLHLLFSYLILLPLASYFWLADEILFGSYRQIQIVKPVITISAPRAGTTSFHRLLALDDRFVTPSIVELVLPFLCIHKVLYFLNEKFPNAIATIERALKWANGITPEVEAHHPISLFAPDADDVLIGEWHWASVGSCRTFPVVDYMYKHYQMRSLGERDRSRSLSFHAILLQKISFHHMDGQGRCKRILLRSHLSPCIDGFRSMYPDAVFVGILRDPVAVLCSLAGLTRVVVRATTGVDLLLEMQESIKDKSSKGKSITWSKVLVAILSDMFKREAQLFDKSSSQKGYYVTFPQFMADPCATIRNLYKEIGIEMTLQFESAMHKSLDEHNSYKDRHRYKNLTLEDLAVDEEEYRAIPSVKHYSSLLDP